MKPAILAPKGAADKKPPHGAPCNRCGLCCIATLCPLGRHVFGRETGPCPALRWDADGDSSCGMIDDPGRYSPVRTALYGETAMRVGARFLVGSGTGCDARINGEPADLSFYATLRAWDRRFRAEVRAAKKAWGMA